jgi:hypothetical protein
MPEELFCKKQSAFLQRHDDGLLVPLHEKEPFPEGKQANND